MNRLTHLILLIITTACFSIPAFCAEDQSQAWLSRSVGSWSKAFGPEAGAKIIKSIDLLRQAGKPSFDLTTIRSSAGDGSLSSNAFKYLDEAMARERMLDQSDKIASEVAKACLKPKLKQEFIDPQMTLSKFLRCKMRIIIGITRAAVAQKMAQPDFRSYCSQAMESSVDALRDAIKLAGDNKVFLGDANPPASAITDLRSRILNIWDTSQKAASVEPVREMQLGKMLEDSLWAKAAGTSSE